MQKRILVIALLLNLFFVAGTYSQSGKPVALKVAKNGFDLQFENGTPFFWLGDTAWELFHRLTLPEIKLYLQNRAEKGFNVIQAVVLAEFDGLRIPNRYGQLPFFDQDPSKPNEKYFSLIDSTIQLCKDLNLFLALLPTWGDKVTSNWGAGPVIFDSARAYRYGQWLGNRYRNEPNIIWILGGDRPAVNNSHDWRPIWRAMANGISKSSKGKQLITYHPSGGSQSTSQWIHNEPWLDVNMFQSGHGGGRDVPCWELVIRDRKLQPARPTLDAEPNYEDHPVSPWPKWHVDSGYFRDYDVRKQLYRSVFSGACGVTYGHHAIWQFMNEREEAINYPDRGWLNALNRPGAFQAGYLRKLIESRPFVNRVPDQAMIKEGQGIKSEYIAAFRAFDNSYGMVYLPVGKKITLDLGWLKSESITATWFNPRNGKVASSSKVSGKNILEFTSPTTGIGEDWVLIIEN